MLRPGGRYNEAGTAPPHWRDKRPNRFAAAIDRSLRLPVRETLLGRHRNQLVYPLIQRCVVSDERKQPHTDRQARSQRRWMSEPPRLTDVCAVPCQCLVRKAETEKGIRQIRL